MNLSGLAPFGIAPSFIVATEEILAVQEDRMLAPQDSVLENSMEATLEEPLEATNLIVAQPDTNHKTAFCNPPAEIKSDHTIQPLLKEIERIYDLCDSLSSKMQAILQFLQMDGYGIPEKISWNIEWNSSFSMPLDELPSRYHLHQTRNACDTHFRIIRKVRRESLITQVIQGFKRLLPGKLSPSFGPGH